MRTRLLLPALLALVVTATVVPSIARAEVPPVAEPSLFVVRAPAHHDDGVLSVRTKNLEWFTDRPDRDAGRLSTKELVEHWESWGFGSDPPNAALVGDDVDVIGELTKPRIRRGALRFGFEPIRGVPEDGNLGTVSLLIDPTGSSQYSLTVQNNSSNATNLAVYQTDPDLNVPNVFSLAWFAKYAYPTTTVTFTWDQSSQLMWSQTGSLVPGITFQAAQSLDVNPADQGQNSATLTNANGAFQFVQGQGSSAPAGSVGVTMDGTISLDTASIAFGQSGAPVFAAQAQPNYNVVFTPHPNYWLTFGPYQQGQVLDVGQITNNVQIPFPPGVTSMTATLNQDNTWTVQPTG
jgi:hypothetical protein